LVAQIEQRLEPAKIEWEPVEATATRPLDYGTLRKVQFRDLPLETSLNLEGWMDVSPGGSITEEEDGDPLLNDTLRTNQLAVNMQLLRMALVGMGDNFKREHSQLEESDDALERGSDT
jgi:hypothetical protein